MRNFWTLLLCCAWSPMGVLAQNTDQGARAAATSVPPVEISVSYSSLRANQGPGQCGCFNMNGGSTEITFHPYHWFSAVADLTGEHSGSVNGGGQGLSLISYTAGPRFIYSIHDRYELFAQALFGGAHGFDTYFPVASGTIGASNSFAMLTGGGLDIRVKPYLAIRPVQADYFLTHLPNGVNNRQNNLRLSAGLVFRLW
jgi:outer membrane immunogenic protein